MNMRCDTVRDLIPLCRDGIASAASRVIVEEHLKSCPACRNYYKAYIKSKEKRAARGYHRNDEESGRICRAVKKDPPPPSDLYDGRSHGRNRFPSRRVVHLRKK